MVADVGGGTGVISSRVPCRWGAIVGSVARSVSSLLECAVPRQVVRPARLQHRPEVMTGPGSDGRGLRDPDATIHGDAVDGVPRNRTVHDAMRGVAAKGLWASPG
jgi:hypothetical protein